MSSPTRAILLFGTIALLGCGSEGERKDLSAWLQQHAEASTGMAPEAARPAAAEGATGSPEEPAVGTARPNAATAAEATGDGGAVRHGAPVSKDVHDPRTGGGRPAPKHPSSERPTPAIDPRWDPSAFVARPLIGPFADENVLCDALGPVMFEPDVPDATAEVKCSFGKPVRLGEKERTAKPWSDWQVYVLSVEATGDTGRTVDERLVMRGPGGWFVGPTLAVAFERSPVEDERISWVLRDVVPGGPPELVAIHRGKTHDIMMGVNSDIVTEEQAMTICGFGSNALPSCTVPVEFVRYSEERPYTPGDPIGEEGHPRAPEPPSGWRMFHRFEAGTLVLRRTWGRLPPEYAHLEGYHYVVLP